MVHVADERTSRFLLAALVVWPTVLGSPPTANAQMLRGTVRDEVTRESVEAAEVAVLRAEAHVRSVYSDSRGRFSVRLPFAGCSSSR